MSELFLSVADHLGFERPWINAGEPFFHRGGEQANVRNFTKMFGDEPDRLLRGHPMEPIESGEIYWA